MLRKALYPKIESILKYVAGKLEARHITPNQLTLLGLVLTFVTGWIYSTGYLFLGGIFLLLSGIGDLLDGPLARLSGQVTKFGAFLDSTVDRYSDFFIFGGLAFYFAKIGRVDWFILVMGTLVGSFVTSYAKARAENFIESCRVGFFERAERVLLLALGTLIPVTFPFVIWILFIGTNVTAIQRILYTRKTLSKDQG